ncbi:hypothetical protein [Candidatus Pyrohabitans sp.]
MSGMLVNREINKKGLLNLLLSGAIFIFVSSISNFLMGLYYAAIILAICWIPKALLKYDKINKVDLLNIILSAGVVIFVSNASSFSLGIFYSAIIFGIYWIPKMSWQMEKRYTKK